MRITNTSFKSEKAPCGQIGEGDRHRDEDGECMLTDRVLFACGCQVVRHEYHNGTVFPFGGALRRQGPGGQDEQSFLKGRRPRTVRCERTAVSARKGCG